MECFPKVEDRDLVLGPQAPIKGNDGFLDKLYHCQFVRDESFRLSILIAFH
jgi:hypothetical protein